MPKYDILSDFESWEKIAEEISEYLISRGCEKKAVISFMVAAEEIFTNISEYAYPLLKGLVTVNANMDDSNIVRLEFWDAGEKFNPLKAKIPDINASAGKREIGGLGIYIARKRTDEMYYEYNNGKNHLVLIKKF